MLTRFVPVRLLDTTGRWCGLASGLGGELLTWGLATSGLACDGVLVCCSEGERRSCRDVVMGGKDASWRVCHAQNNR